MVKERTEEQKLAQSPLTVMLGGVEHTVNLLVIKESRIWRQKVVKVWASLPGHLQANSDKPQEFEAALSALLVEMPDVVVDLFFEYAKDLNRGEIENIATDAEMAKAFQEITKVAFPLAQSAPEVMMRLYSTEQCSQ